jgi:hypothetical protein
MYAEITTALSSIKVASDLASLVLKTKVDSAVTQKAIELQSAIISLQTAIMSIQSQNQELLAENDRLKQQLAAIKNWEAETQKYHLKEVARGVFVYLLNEDQSGAQPSPWFCYNCYEKQQKSILQRGPKTLHGHSYSCANCDNTIYCYPFK